MKLGVFTPVLYGMALDDALGYLAKHGVRMAEIGCGGFPGKDHCDPDILLNDSGELSRFTELFKKHNIEISAISCHANPLHPDKDQAKEYDKAITDGILLAEKLGINRINTFSGCPGDGPGAVAPNWVVAPWPNDFKGVLDYQWNEVLIPYWRKKAAFAKEHGVDMIGFEMHPGFCVYNPYTLLKLRDAVGNCIGANLDPSHLIWQGMDTVAVIKELKGAIFHFHAKDTAIDKYETAKNGVLDTRPYADVANRSWIFRTVGYGSITAEEWKGIISALRTVGYDYAISIEHEDALMSPNEGLEKAIDFLRGILINEPCGDIWWE